MLKESFDPSVDEQERGCWSQMGPGAGREGARSGQEEQAGSRQGRGQEQAGSRIPVSVFHYNNSGSAAENGPRVLADAAELLCGGKGYKEVRLLFSWMWEFLFFLPCA